MSAQKKKQSEGHWEMTDTRCPKCGNHAARNLKTGVLKCSYVKCGVQFKPTATNNGDTKADGFNYYIVVSVNVGVSKEMIGRLRREFGIPKVIDILVPYPFEPVKDEKIKELFKQAENGVDQKVLKYPRVEFNFFDKHAREAAIRRHAEELAEAKK